jgi:hypothetical protein
MIQFQMWYGMRRDVWHLQSERAKLAVLLPSTAVLLLLVFLCMGVVSTQHCCCCAPAFRRHGGELLTVSDAMYRLYGQEDCSI